ncbi:PhzF family phenazine biosynthesis protein [Allorhizocola rhizosphaerae]|uniref:PhzF family phenazine biosynthesis protein n=1 Tax=Allorhizocola rhizosphaerae TaxID=1872709 RepID=UPI000E3D036F|nr:PhzF family phenazine biosynthesis protein [Allorhizocola rhizosphaerae]
MEFALVDVFADRPLTGNPLAVVADADALPDSVLARVAGEFNQSETTFLMRPTVAGAAWRLRSFTAAGVEVFGAGHNALGAWWWLAATDRLGAPASGSTWYQQLGDRVLPVTVTSADGGVTVAMRQAEVRYGETVADTDRLARALGLRAEELGAAPALPVAQVVDTGAPHLLVGCRDRAAVDKARPDAGVLRGLVREVEGEGVYLYATDPAGNDVDAYARFFNPTAGIAEDPATGSAAGPLACLLHRHGAAGRLVVVGQGHAMARPSRIRVEVDTAPIITGTATVFASGKLFISGENAEQ